MAILSVFFSIFDHSEMEKWHRLLAINTGDATGNYAHLFMQLKVQELEERLAPGEKYRNESL